MLKIFGTTVVLFNLLGCLGWWLLGWDWRWCHGVATALGLVAPVVLLLLCWRGAQ